MASVTTTDSPLADSGPTADELEGTRKRFRAGVLHDAESLENLSVEPQAPDAWFRRLSAVDALGVDSVKNAWSALQKAPTVLVVYGPAEALQPALKNLGAMTVITP